MCVWKKEIIKCVWRRCASMVLLWFGCVGHKYGKVTVCARGIVNVGVSMMSALRMPDAILCARTIVNVGSMMCALRMPDAMRMPYAIFYVWVWRTVAEWMWQLVLSYPHHAD
jgi:hypothetical protein